MLFGCVCFSTKQKNHHGNIFGHPGIPSSHILSLPGPTLAVAADSIHRWNPTDSTQDLAANVVGTPGVEGWDVEGLGKGHSFEIQQIFKSLVLENHRTLPNFIGFFLHMTPWNEISKLDTPQFLEKV